ncbi:hypothetical protein D3C87_1881440 [compost metagenome]
MQDFALGAFPFALPAIGGFLQFQGRQRFVSAIAVIAFGECQGLALQRAAQFQVAMVFLIEIAAGHFVSLEVQLQHDGHLAQRAGEHSPAVLGMSRGTQHE